MTASHTPYSKANPFLASIKERYSLCKPGSSKSTHHVVLDLTGSNMTYEVGDSIAIFPINDPGIVHKTLQAINASGLETIVDKNSNEEWLLNYFLANKANLAEVPRKLIAEMSGRQTNLEKKEKLAHLLSEGHRDELKAYQANHEVWDALEENKEASLAPQELCNLLMPLLPRFYSIASSQKIVGDEVHLTVAETRYETNGYIRVGVCTHYLCRLAPMHQWIVPVYVQPHHGFTVPENLEANLIMVGPGTGVAPFRAFMQEREALKARGKNWLFFGECHRDYNFFYEEYWKGLEQSGKMRLSTAFSRDQENKIYVQHRMLEHGAELFAELEQGAYLYVCGDAHHMAKDVEAALHTIIEQHGHLDAQAAKQYVKKLRAEKRYLRDIY